MADRFVVIEAPFNSSGAFDGVARMPETLAAAGLYDALGKGVVRRRATFDPPVAVRGPTGLLAEDALIAMIASLGALTARSLEEGSWPLVVGGDCSVLLGAMAGLQDTGRPTGLIFVDGHEDAWPPQVSTTGETADCDLGLALGWYPLPGSLVSRPALVLAEHVHVLGPRDYEELSTAGIESISNRVEIVRGSDLAQVDTADAGARAANALRGITEQWWLHVDLDVLSTAALSAVDYPQPGGLDWPQLDALTAGALSQGGCVGASVVIYNPDLDRGAHAPRIVTYIAQLVAAR